MVKMAKNRKKLGHFVYKYYQSTKVSVGVFSPTSRGPVLGGEEGTTLIGEKSPLSPAPLIVSGMPHLIGLM